MDQLDYDLWEINSDCIKHVHVGLTVVDYPEEGIDLEPHFRGFNGIETTLGRVIAVCYSLDKPGNRNAFFPWKLLLGNGQDGLAEITFTSEKEIKEFLDRDQPFRDYSLDE